MCPALLLVTVLTTCQRASLASAARSGPSVALSRVTASLTYVGSILTSLGDGEYGNLIAQ
jgi:hypothetical protein